MSAETLERQASNSTDIELVTSITPTSLVVLKPLKENR
jgi:hypothetical protein